MKWTHPKTYTLTRKEWCLLRDVIIRDSARGSQLREDALKILSTSYDKSYETMIKEEKQLPELAGKEPKAYYHDNGQLWWKGDYKDGKKDGPWVYYHENGQLESKGDWKDGEPDGPWVGYWDNGQLWMKGDYKDGKEDGPWVEYYHNGQLEWKGDYKDGKLII